MDDDSEFLQLEYDETRIPALDALEVFVPDDFKRDPEFNELCSRTGHSRWIPVEGGHQVLILYEGGGFDATRFALRKGAWDHEHCKRCIARIDPMTLCWVSTDNSFVIVCAECHEFLFPEDR